MKLNAIPSVLAVATLAALSPSAHAFSPLALLGQLVAFKIGDKVADRATDSSGKVIDKAFNNANEAGSLDGCTDEERKLEDRMAHDYVMAQMSGQGGMPPRLKCTYKQQTGLAQTALPNPYLPGFVQMANGMPGTVPTTANGGLNPGTAFTGATGYPGGYMQTGYNPYQQSVSGYLPTGYNTGYPQAGYNPYQQVGYNTGYPQAGYQQPCYVNGMAQPCNAGYNTGYPQTGYNNGYVNGYPQTGGYGQGGYPQAGYNNGYVQNGTYPQAGYNTGYNPGLAPTNGYNPNLASTNGYNTGYQQTGYTNGLAGNTAAWTTGSFFDDLSAERDGAPPSRYDVAGSILVGSGSLGRSIQTSQAGSVTPRVQLAGSLVLEFDGYLGEAASQLNVLLTDASGTQKVTTNGAGGSQYNGTSGPAVAGFNQPPAWQHYSLAVKDGGLALFVGQQQMLLLNNVTVRPTRVGLEMVCANGPAGCRGAAIRNVKVTSVI